MNIQLLFTWVVAVGAVCLTLATVLLWLHEKGIRPAYEILRFYKMFPWPVRVGLIVISFHLYGIGSNKNPTNPPPAGLPPRMLTVQEPTTGFSAAQIAARAAIVGVGTNEVWQFDLTRQDVTSTNLNIVERWWLRGAANERVTLGCSHPTEGTIAVDTFGRVWTDEHVYSPLGLQIGLVPEAKWAEIGHESVAWWMVTASNTTVVTWENALLFRETNYPVSVQAEFYDDGRFAYRYDLSSVGAAVSNIFAQVITSEGVEGVSLGGGVTSVRGHLLDEIDGRVEDKDEDGVSTYDEIFVYGTDPDLPDTDGDGIPDGDEIANGWNPLVGDVTDAEIIARVAAGVTNETYEIISDELEATKLWDGFVFRRRVDGVSLVVRGEDTASTNVVYARTFAVDRKDGWRSYFLSGRGESWCCSGEDATHDWSLIGAVLDWADDCGNAGTITNSPSGDSLYLPLAAEVTSVTLTLRQTAVRAASPQPVYLLAHTPRIEFPGSQGILGDDGNEYSVYETCDTISMSVDRSNRPCHATTFDGEATEADYALPSGAGVYPWPGEVESVAPMRTQAGLASKLASTGRGRTNGGGGGRHYLVVIDPWVTYGTAHYGCCHDYPYNWGWFGYWCDCTPECGAGVDHDAVDAYIDWYDDESAVGVVEVGGIEVWRDTAYHVVWGCDHDHDDEPEGYCPCGCDGDCAYCSCKRTDGPSQGSIRFRVSLGECWNGDVAGFAWFESDGPVRIRPQLFEFETNPNASVTVSQSGSTVIATTYETNGRDLAIAAISNGVTVAVRHHGAMNPYQTWEVSNVSNLTSVVRMVRRDIAGAIREDWTYAYCASSNEWAVTDNLAVGLPEGPETMTVENGTNWVYAADGRLLRLTVGTNEEEVVIRTFSYDEQGRMTCVDDGTNGCVTITYDAAGNVSSMTGPEGTLSAAWDEDGVVTNLDTSAWNGPIPMMGPPMTMSGVGGGGGITPHSALWHFLFGNGAPLSMPFSEIDTDWLTPTSFDCVKNFVSSCHEPEEYPVFGTRVISTKGAQQYYLGHITIRLDGWITYTGHCNWTFEGTIRGLDDRYDFNKANRGLVAETLTTIGRVLFEAHGTTYTISFTGTKTLTGSGHCGDK